MFKILPQMDAISQHQMTKEISGLDARRILEENIKMNRMKIMGGEMKDGMTSVTSRYADVADAHKHLKNYERDYKRTCPETLTPAVKNAMWKRAKQLKDEFVIGMLSRDELHPVKSIQSDGSMQTVVDNERMTTTRSVERNTTWYKRNDSKLNEFKNIMRHLCPDDPLASDIERFRPKGGHG